MFSPPTQPGCRSLFHFLRHSASFSEMPPAEPVFRPAFSLRRRRRFRLLPRIFFACLISFSPLAADIAIFPQVVSPAMSLPVSTAFQPIFATPLRFATFAAAAFS